MACVAGGLQPGVGGERVAIFGHLEIAGKIGQRPQFHAHRPEQVGQFDPLLSIGSAEDEHGDGENNGWRLAIGPGATGTTSHFR